MDLGYDVIVTLTGIVLVFLILVLLMLIIKLEGKLFDSMSGKKSAPKPAAKPARSLRQSPQLRRLPLLHRWWSRVCLARSWLPLWRRSLRWAAASTPSRQCAAATITGAELASTTPPRRFNTGGRA